MMTKTTILIMHGRRRNPGERNGKTEQVTAVTSSNSLRRSWIIVVRRRKKARQKDPSIHSFLPSWCHAVSVSSSSRQPVERRKDLRSIDTKWSWWSFIMDHQEVAMTCFIKWHPHDDDGDHRLSSILSYFSFLIRFHLRLRRHVLLPLILVLLLSLFSHRFSTQQRGEDIKNIRLTRKEKEKVINDFKVTFSARISTNFPFLPYFIMSRPTHSTFSGLWNFFILDFRSIRYLDSFLLLILVLSPVKKI